MKFFGREFSLSKYDGLDGKTKVAFTEIDETKAVFHFMIIADSEGIMFNGISPKIVTSRDLQEFAHLVSKVWEEHEKLAPKIVTNLAGH